MKRLIRLTALVAVFAAMPAFAQNQRGPLTSHSFASDFQTIPVMGNVPGVGGTFQSYVAIFNPTTSSFPVTVALYDTNGTKREATITLAAGEIKTYDNFLQTVFNYTGGGAATFSAPESAGGGRTNRFILSTEVLTGGTHYSTMIPVVEFAGTGSRSFSAGISINAATRTNVGCFNQSSLANPVGITVWNTAGTQVASASLNLAPNAWTQVNVSSPTPVTSGYVRFEPSDAAVCYAVVVDNATNDGRFIAAAEYAP